MCTLLRMRLESISVSPRARRQAVKLLQWRGRWFGCSTANLTFTDIAQALRPALLVSLSEDSGDPAPRGTVRELSPTQSPLEQAICGMFLETLYSISLSLPLSLSLSRAWGTVRSPGLQAHPIVFIGTGGVSSECSAPRSYSHKVCDVDKGCTYTLKDIRSKAQIPGSNQRTQTQLLTSR